MLGGPWLEPLYASYNRPSCAAGDPVRFLHAHADVREREVVGLIAAFLAYGRLETILRSVENALARLEGAPRRFLLSAGPDRLRAACDGFRHRLIEEEGFYRFLRSVRTLLETHGSVEAAFVCYDDARDATVVTGLAGLARELRGRWGAPEHLVADPAGGSACKRWNLYLRWMVRADRVDPGGWTRVAPSRLVVPLDAHMWSVCRQLGLTERKTCNLAAALEVTAAFGQAAPDDPVRYDFALMHASRDGTLWETLRNCKA